MKFKSVGLAILLTLGVFIVGMLAMNFVVMPLLVHQRNSVIVPDVRSMSEQQAKDFLARYSLEMRISRSEFDVDLPEGYVLSQSPRANDSVKEGRTVSVVISRGARTQRVPELKGMTLRQGRLLLTRQKLNPGRIARVRQEDDSRETVIACAPNAGKEVDEGVDVNLLIRVGGEAKRYLMPNLEGQDLLFIKDKLDKMGFRVGNIRYESRGDVYPNTIIGHTPSAGIMIREGDSIELVAAGSE